MKFNYNSFLIILSCCFASWLPAAQRDNQLMDPYESKLFTFAENHRWDMVHITLINNQIRPMTPDGKDVIDQNGLTLLHLAVQNNQEDIVKILLEKGASLGNDDELLEKDGKLLRVPSPLHKAVELGYDSIVKSLLKKYPGKINSTLCCHQNTPLHIAAWFGQKNIIDLLLEQGADISAMNELGSTPIHCAVWTKKLDCVKQLLAHNSDKTLSTAQTQNNNLNSPLALAKQVNAKDIEIIILNYLKSKLNPDAFLDYVNAHQMHDRLRSLRLDASLPN